MFVSLSLHHLTLTIHPHHSLLGTYMGRHGLQLNLTLDLAPPKQQLVLVRVLDDVGSFWTRDGEVHLVRHSSHLLWRDEAQPLIAEGKLELTL
jgi:GINS complex subunit 1